MFTNFEVFENPVVFSFYINNCMVCYIYTEKTVYLMNLVLGVLWLLLMLSLVHYDVRLFILDVYF